MVRFVLLHFHPLDSSSTHAVSEFVWTFMESELIPWKFFGACVALQRNLATFILVGNNSLCFDLAFAVFAGADQVSCRISECYVWNITNQVDIANWTSGCRLIHLSILARTAN